MNSKYSPKKILVNGCSHTQTVIPNINREEGYSLSWANLLSKKLNCEVVNLATLGKSNFIILEETQRYLLNYDDVNHVVVQLTELHRWAFYKRKESFLFEPTEPQTQFDRLSSRTSTYYIKFPGLESKPKVTVTDNIPKQIKNTHVLGDASFFYESLSIMTMLFGLYHYCNSNNIRLTVLPYHSIANGDMLEDAVFKSVPSFIFIQENYDIGLIDYLKIYYKIEGGHFVAEAHEKVSDIVADHILYNTQIYIDPKRVKATEKIIYNYSS